VSAVFNVLLFFGLSTLSVQLLPAGIASVVLYLQPVFIAGLAHVWLGERLTRTKMAGLLLGLGGVAAIMVQGMEGTLSPSGLAYGVGSAAAWALGTVAFKRAAPRSILWFIALPFLLGGLLIVAAGLAVGERWADIAWTPTFLLVLAYGAAVGLAHLWLGERLTRTKMAGLLLGFGGVASIMVHGIEGTLSPAGLAYGVGSAAAWALGTVAFKRAAPRSILWFIALPFLLGGLLIIAGGLTLGERWADIAWTPTFVLVLAYGAAVGLALSWTLWLALVAAGEASRMAGNTFLVPLVSVAAGTLFLGEPLTAMLAVGGLAVMAGVYLVNRPALAG
jgi:drug/metabolite transporter (DMT)-like permease